jgi:cytochrome c peroxidase
MVDRASGGNSCRCSEFRFGGGQQTSALADDNCAGQSRARGYRHTRSHSRSRSIGPTQITRPSWPPAELTRRAIPPDNPQTPDKIALGEKLFFDGRLSADGSVACSTCHDPARAFTDGRPSSIGIQGLLGQRNAPTILNALYNKSQFWDGQAKTLEEQAAFPIVNPVEMGQPSILAAIARIAAIEDYRQAFRRVFGRPPNGPDLVRAIASYERRQASLDSAFNRFVPGDNTAIDASTKRGWELFNTKGRCNKCHALTEEKRDVTTFTDNDFHNIGIGIIRHNVVALARQAERVIKSGNADAIDRAAVGTDFSALGHYLITRKQADIAAFKTPDVRNILVTGRIFTTARKRRCGMSSITTTTAMACKTRVSTKTSSPSP